ncbi:hypothetical protein [Rhodococcus triatomae]
MREWREFGKAVVAAAIACGLPAAAIAVVDDPSRTAALSDWIRMLGVVLAVWCVVALSYTGDPARAGSPE